MDVLDNPEELGKRIAAARSYAGDTIESFAPKIGVSVPTLRSYERGKLGDYSGSRELRKALAENVQRASNAPPEVLGLSELESGEADRLRRTIEAQMNAMKMELLKEIEKVRRAQASPPSSQAPGARG